jgi:hypothetical protein
MVTVAAPSVAVLDAVNVSVLAPVAEAGLNAADTPEGKPVALSATLLVNPPLGVTVIVLVAVAPWLIDTLEGLADNAKLGVGGAVTVRAIAVVCVSVPLAPVIVTVEEPGAAVLAAVSVTTVLVPVVAVVAGLKLAVTPVGKPLAVNVTAAANPPVRVMLIVLVPLAPVLSVRLAGLSDNEKFGAGGALFRSP